MDRKLLNLWASKEHSFFFWNITFHNRNNKRLLEKTESNMYIQFIASGQGNIGRGEAEPNIILYGRNQLDVGQGQVKLVFYNTEKIGSNKQVVCKRLVSSKVTLT